MFILTLNYIGSYIQLLDQKVYWFSDRLLPNLAKCDGTLIATKERAPSIISDFTRMRSHQPMFKSDRTLIDTKERSCLYRALDIIVKVNINFPL